MPSADTAVPTSLQPASLLQLIWLASPALPVGGFSYSEGLEAAVESGFVHDEHSAADWLVDQLQLTLVRSELSVMAQAINAWRANDVAVLRQLNSWVLTTRETSELRAQTEQMGRSLLEWLRNHHTASAEQIATCATFDPTYPIAFALAVAGTQASVRDGLLAFTFGWAENMTQSAIKAVPLGQSAGQRILSRLAAAIPDAVQQGMALPEDDRQAFSPMWAILSAQHETQYSRLFRS